MSDCVEEIGALFDGGAWDPFARENRREITIIRHPDGTETPLADVLWDGPIRSINCTPSGCFMAIGNASWKGTAFDGPWTRSNDINNIDPEEFVRATNGRLAASVSEHGSWWGGRYSVWVDPDANRLLRIELADGISSWAPTPSKGCAGDHHCL